MVNWLDLSVVDCLREWQIIMRSDNLQDVYNIKTVAKGRVRAYVN